MRLNRIFVCAIAPMLLLPAMAALPAYGQATVTGKVDFTSEVKLGQKVPNRDAVVWLTPQDGESPAGPPQPKTVQLLQKNKTFHPHLLVIPAGSTVVFPNRDPFFHNVFSLFEGKRFDLGMYESGSSRAVKFDRAGISYIFCNIHPEMSAVVITVTTPFYASTDAKGNFSMANVPRGEYRVDVWADGASPEALQKLARSLSVSGPATSIGTLQVPVTTLLAHKNKYGRDYDPVIKAPYEHP